VLAAGGGFIGDADRGAAFFAPRLGFRRRLTR
jgi:hypothetical protein